MAAVGLSATLPAAAGPPPIHVPDGDIVALAAAIDAVNAAKTTDSQWIVLADGGRYVFTEPLGDEAALPTILPPTILFIRGSGATIERSGKPGTPAFRLLDSRTYLELTDLTLRNGDAGPDGSGGAIHAGDSTLVLSRCLLEGNRAGVAGGAVAGDDGSDICVFDTVLRDNSAPRGGAIEASGVEAIGSRFEGNVATSGSGGAIRATSVGNPFNGLWQCAFIDNTAAGSGGGVIVEGDCLAAIFSTRFVGNVAVEGSGGGLAVTGQPASGCFPASAFRSTFRANRAGGDGGGLFLAGSGLEFSIRESLFAENEATGAGGGMWVDGQEAPVVNTTFSGNRAGVRGGAMSLEGAATSQLRGVTIHENVGEPGETAVHVGEDAAASLSHVIVSGSPAGTLVSGSYVDAGWNIVEDGTGLTEPTSLAADPELLPLAANGGPTMTHAPGCGSPARDGGNCAALALEDDQRDAPRPMPAGSACDIGAFEVQMPELDFDCDGVVGIGEILAVLEAWGSCAGCPEDLDGDGTVDFDDLLLVFTIFEI